MNAHSRLVARFRAARRDPTLAVLEGLHALKHALRFGAEVLQACTPEPAHVAALAGQLAPDIEPQLLALLEPVPPRLFAELAPRPPKTGVIAIARRRQPAAGELFRQPRRAAVVLLDRPTHAGNVGAVVRVAAAAGAAGVVTTGPLDPWHPAALRGAAGLQFAVATVRIATLPTDVGPLVLFDPQGEAFAPALLPQDAVLCFGSERHGLSQQLVRRAERCFALPMRPGVSSLNLATSVAAVLYAARLSASGDGSS